MSRRSSCVIGNIITSVVHVNNHRRSPAGSPHLPRPKCVRHSAAQLRATVRFVQPPVRSIGQSTRPSKFPYWPPTHRVLPQAVSQPPGKSRDELNKQEIVVDPELNPDPQLEDEYRNCLAHGRAARVSDEPFFPLILAQRPRHSQAGPRLPTPTTRHFLHWC